ncbi:MAG: hypothetical protein ACM3H7_05850 [Acidobacteriaceae bacterium]
MSLKLHFPENGWEVISRDWSAWWAGELDRPLVVLECLPVGVAATPHFASTFLGNYGLHTPAEELLELFVPRLEATHYLGDAFPRFWPNFGPGIVATCAGARLHAVSDTTWFSASSKGEIADLHIDRWARDEWWQRVMAVTQTAVERWGKQLSIGFTDLGGILDILASLRGTQQLLLDLHDAAPEVSRLAREINTLWLGCYEELYALTRTGRGITCWGPCWSPGRGYLLQSDFSYMISPAMFKRYVLPDISACCERFEYAFYHLDGKGQLPHLEMLLALEHLRGIQWVPGDGQPQAEHWTALLKHILQSGKLCQVYVGAEGALQILNELGGKNLLLVINETLSPEEGKALLDEIHRTR